MNIPDSTIVLPDIMTSAVRVVSSDHEAAMKNLVAREPFLASYICEQMTNIVGRLTMGSAPADAIQEAHEHFLQLILLSLEASRQGHFELWKDVAEGEHLRKITEQDEATAAAEEDEDDGGSEVSDVEF